MVRRGVLFLEKICVENYYPLGFESGDEKVTV
jgi:hypothetical protein